MLIRVLSLVLVLSGLAASEPTLHDILAKYTAATGGQAAAKRVSTQVRRGILKMGPETQLRILVEANREGQWRMAFALAEDISFEHVFDGKAGWTHMPDTTAPMRPDDVASEDPAFSLVAALAPERYFAGFTVKGCESSGGRDAWVIEGSRDGGPALRALFDTETGLLVRADKTILEDYRAVDGVKVPFKLRFIEKRGEQVVEFTEVRNNADIGATRFDKDASGATYREATRQATLRAVAKRIEGIDAGPTRAVLEGMHNFTAEDGRMLYDIIVQNGYRRGLEIGTAEGNSALWMGMAFRKNGGRLVTIDRNAERAKVAVENFRQAGLTSVIDCRTADAFDAIPKLEGTFDFVFMDTGAPIHKKLLDLVYERLAPGAAVVSHNANTLERADPAFWKATHEDPKLETKVTRTPGGGILVAKKK